MLLIVASAAVVAGTWGLALLGGSLATGSGPDSTDVATPLMTGTIPISLGVAAALVYLGLRPPKRAGRYLSNREMRSLSLWVALIPLSIILTTTVLAVIPLPWLFIVVLFPIPVDNPIEFLLVVTIPASLWIHIRHALCILRPRNP